MSRRRYYDYWEKSKPIQTKGGIKAQSKRGAFGQSWWAKRWIEVLESYNIGARLSRGRSYARGGQVTGIQVEKGKVEAKVQGSRRTPYKVTIRVPRLKKDDWQKVGKALAERASFAARLLAGEMPDNIGEVFQAAGLSLFPGRNKDLETECSCPDWSNPCKHVAAVYYLLGEAFDGDPFLIFKMRGLDRDELSALIGDLPLQYEEPQLPPEPLPDEPESFWGTLDKLPALELDTERPAIDAAFPRRLGAFPFWRGECPFLESLQEIYARATPIGQTTAAPDHAQE